jgi:hypothetical protein
MSITLNELQTWSEQLPDQTSEEAAMLRAMVARREAELRLRIADLIATVSERENWKLHQCAATARRIEQTPANLLEAVHQYFQTRNDGHPHFEAPEIVVDFTPANWPMMDITEASNAVSPLAKSALPAVASSESVDDLYGRMSTLESLISPTPAYGCGIQGIRLMRMVALMSKARSARLAQMRISGTQAIYQHT